LDGEEVFERTAEKYADCRTYADSGRIESDSGVVTFKTFFVRPNLFKFEFTRRAGDEDTSGIIWSDGNEFFSTYNHALDHIPCDSFSSLFAEIGSAGTAVSYLVPMLLLPDYAGPHALANASPYVSVEHTSIADRSCHRIRSTNIDAPLKADLLIDSLGYKFRRMIIDLSSSSTSTSKTSTNENSTSENSVLENLTGENSTSEYKPESTSQVTFADVTFDRDIPEDLFKLKHG
jgi:outer membrane lipoprotein-sorting protein